MKKAFFFLTLSFLPAALSAQTISDARAAAIGSTVTFSGVSLNGSELVSIRYIQQNNVAIAVYGSAVNGVNRGDSVSITGTLTNYNNLLEVTPVTTLTPHGNVALPAMQLITNVNQITDTLEGELVRIDNCVFADAGTVFTGNTNYTVTGANGSFDVRIMNGNPIVGTVIPSELISLRGILSQYCYDPTSGCTSGYQLLPRDLNDLASESSITLISPLTATNITQNSFDVSWTTNVAGDESYVKYGLTNSLELGSQAASNAVTHLATLSGLQPGTIYYAKAYSVNGQDTISTNIGVFATQSLSTGKIINYFNRPVDNSIAITGNNALTLTSLVDDTLAAYINRADSTLDIAVYNWDHISGGATIVDAVNAAYQRGVKVRIIHDGSSNNAAIDYLDPAIHHLSTPQGADYTIMHNKFVIIDANHADPNQAFVWTGSTNFTYQQLSIDANNVIIVQDQSLARGYKLEFDEMWGDSDENSQPNTITGRFGQFKTDNTPHLYNIAGVKVESFFSPSDQVNSVILRTLNTADNDIRYAVMAFTRSDLANAIKTKVIGGIPARGIENDASESATSFGILSPVMNSNLIDYPFDWIMHHKYVVIDGIDNSSDPVVLTGSHNWSTAADQNNDENTLIVHDLNVANRYLQDFEGRWCESTNQNCALSLEESTLNGELVVYPNPATADFSVKLPGQKSGTVSIVNSAGIMIEQKTVDPVTGGTPIFSLGKTAPGVYIVSFTTQDGVYTSRLIVE